jgi:C1A family cysteine protease
VTEHEAIQQAIEKSGAKWQAGPTSMASLSPQQRARRLGVLDRAQAIAHAQAKGQDAAFAGATWPANHSWLDLGMVTPVKDQGDCGTCVSFATVAALETLLMINNGLALNLSEGDLHFCSSHGANCDGWDPQPALDVLTSRGVCDEACAPYSVGNCTSCADRASRIVKIATQAHYSSGDTYRVRLSSVGPLVLCFDVYDDFYYYAGGIYSHVNGNLVGSHCVEVIGYSDVDRAWQCKNSWGTGWGERGFFRIAYGQCGIDDAAWEIRAPLTIADSLRPKQRVIYRIAGSSALQDSHWSGSDGWETNLLAAVGLVMEGAGRIRPYKQPDGSQHLIWSDGNGINELWRTPNSIWNVGSLQNVANAPQPAGDPWGYAQPNGNQHVIYRGSDKLIHEIWWDPTDGWRVGTISQVAGMPAAASDPCGYADPGGNQHVFYRGDDNLVHELWWNPTNGWQVGTISQVAGMPAAASDPFAYMQPDGSQHVIYRGVNNEMSELYWTAASGWQNGTLAQVAGMPPAQGNPCAYVETSGSQHVVYRGSDSLIHELYWTAATGWHIGSLAQVVGAQPANGDPSAYVEAVGTQHVVYRGSDDNIHELWQGTGGAWAVGTISQVPGMPHAQGDPVGWGVD